MRPAQYAFSNLEGAGAARMLRVRPRAVLRQAANVPSRATTHRAHEWRSDPHTGHTSGGALPASAGGDAAARGRVQVLRLFRAARLIRVLRKYDSVMALLKTVLPPGPRPRLRPAAVL
jgi:hypothetical protein